MRAKNQEALLQFLQTELELGETFVQSVRLARDNHHAGRTKADAIKVTETIRHFTTRIADSDTRAKISAKLEQLERLIAAL